MSAPVDAASSAAARPRRRARSSDDCGAPPRGQNGRGRSPAVGGRRERFRIEEASQHILRDARHVVVISHCARALRTRRSTRRRTGRRPAGVSPNGEVGAHPQVVLVAAGIRCGTGPNSSLTSSMRPVVALGAGEPQHVGRASPDRGGDAVELDARPRRRRRDRKSPMISSGTPSKMKAGARVVGVRARADSRTRCRSPGR